MHSVRRGTRSSSSRLSSLPSASFIHSFRPFLWRPFKPSTTQRRSRLQHGYCIGVSRRSAQATAGKGLAQGPYMAARAGVEPTTLWLRVIASTNAPPCPTVTSYRPISTIHFLLGRPLLLHPSPYASIILFSSPSDRITCPKNPSFLLSAVCCSVSSSSIPITMRTFSLVFFSVHDILCIFLHNHISYALIFFPILFVIVHVSQPYRTVGKINANSRL